MPAPTALSGDAVQAIINISIAQSRRLVSSWLPPPTPEEITSQKTEEQLAKEDAELFRPMPPRLGLGAPIPKDFLESADPKARSQRIPTNERLKRKIMGRARSSSSQEASKPRPRIESNSNDDGDDDDDDEGGRSSLGKPKRRKIALERKGTSAVNEGESDFGTKEDVEGDQKHTKPRVLPASAHGKAAKTPHKHPVRFGAYLDVYIAEKTKKKKKKKLAKDTT